MNYIVEINRFYDWLETNPLTDSSIVLWHALMHINNKCGWKQEFAVAISTLELKTGLSKSSILRSRNVLVQTGRVEFKSRNGQLSAIYSMVSLHSDAQPDTQSGAQTVTQSGAQSGAQTVPITKLKTKLKKTKPLLSVADAPAAKIKDRVFWKKIISTWDDFYFTNKSEKHEYLGKDFKSLEKIYDFLQKRSEAKKWEWTEENAIESFKFFLNRAWNKDQWLKNNFSLPNILSQFNEIANGQAIATTNNQSFGQANSVKPGTSQARTEAARNF